MKLSPVRSPGNFEGRPLSNTVELPNVCCAQFGERPRFPDSGVRSQYPSSTIHPALLSASSVHPEKLGTQGEKEQGAVSGREFLLPENGLVPYMRGSVK